MSAGLLNIYQRIILTWFQPIIFNISEPEIKKYSFWAQGEVKGRWRKDRKEGESREVGEGGLIFVFSVNW